MMFAVQTAADVLAQWMSFSARDGRLLAVPRNRKSGHYSFYFANKQISNFQACLTYQWFYQCSLTFLHIFMHIFICAVSGYSFYTNFFVFKFNILHK